MSAQVTVSSDAPTRDVLTPGQWEKIDHSVDRGLRWLVKQQQGDGSFPTPPQAQPAVTALSTMAFLANGHNANNGPYSQNIQRAIKYIIARQQPNGLISLIVTPRPTEGITRRVPHSIGRTVVYNHAISSLVLCEAYGQQLADDSEAIHQAIEKALAATLEMQKWKKILEHDQGGWRYLDRLRHEEVDSDLSLTGWQLMFLRSAKNAGFDVPKESIDEAVNYVRNCFDSKKHKTFNYMANGRKHVTRAMAGAGILAMAHAGQHQSLEAQQAGDWLLKHSFEEYGIWITGIASPGHHDRYHYGLFLCSQGMYQLGGNHWEQFFPPVAEAVVNAQLPSGAWPNKPRDYDKIYGPSYAASLCILSLSAPNQLLPIFQR